MHCISSVCSAKRVCIRADVSSVVARSACSRAARRFGKLGRCKGRFEVGCPIVVARFGDQVGVGLDVRVAPFAQIAIDHVLVFAGLAEPAAERAQRETLRHARWIRAQLNERRDLIACGLPGRVHGKQLPVLPRERAAHQLRCRARDATLEQRALGPWIDNGGAELLQGADRTFDELDAFLIGLGEQRSIQVFAHDADAHARE